MFGLVPFEKRMMERNPLFTNLFDAFDKSFAQLDPQGFKVDVKDNGDSYELKADLPGFTKEDVTLHYENDYLNISAKKEESHEDKDNKDNYIRRERSYGELSRSFYISDIDKDKATAEFKDGVLKIVLPKLHEHENKPHQIPISG